MKSRTNGPVLAAGYIGMAFFGLAFVVMGAVLPSLIARFSLDTATASTLAGLLPLGILLGSVLFGPIIDRYGYKNLIVLSSIIAVIGLGNAGILRYYRHNQTLNFHNRVWRRNAQRIDKCTCFRCIHRSLKSIKS